ncbi:MAG: hypothetical protein AB1486_05920 [Planctomycetota bacterium]
MEPLLIIAVIAIIIVVALVNQAKAKKRRDAMQTLAERLGLGFDPGKDRELAQRYAFLDKLRSGSDRYAFNVLSGTYQGHAVLAFDYHYETHSTDSKGHRQTHHHYFSFFILRLPIPFPELAIGKESFFSKVAQAFGYDDIDFESHEFSRKFCVRSRDKKFAYDICHARMIEYLLSNEDLTRFRIRTARLLPGAAFGARGAGRGVRRIAKQTRDRSSQERYGGPRCHVS